LEFLEHFHQQRPELPLVVLTACDHARDELKRVVHRLRGAAGSLAFQAIKDFPSSA